MPSKTDYPVDFGVTGNLAIMPATTADNTTANNAFANTVKKGCGCGCGGKDKGGCGGGDIIGDISSMIKENPILFLLGGIAAGYFLSKTGK